MWRDVLCGIRPESLVSPEQVAPFFVTGTNFFDKITSRSLARTNKQTNNKQAGTDRQTSDTHTNASQARVILRYSYAPLHLRRGEPLIRDYDLTTNGNVKSARPRAIRQSDARFSGAGQAGIQLFQTRYGSSNR